MERRFREFPKTLVPCLAKRAPVEVNGEGLRQTTDTQRLKLKLNRTNSCVLTERFLRKKVL